MESFTITVRGGISLEKLEAELAIVSASIGKDILVKENTTIADVNYEYVMSVLESMGSLNQMTLDQRERAYNEVKYRFSMPDEADILVDNEIIRIINNEWTNIVFGREE